MDILKINNLVKEYQNGSTKLYALNNVSFYGKNHGEFISIVGPSGSVIYIITYDRRVGQAYKWRDICK